MTTEPNKKDFITIIGMVGIVLVVAGVMALGITLLNRANTVDDEPNLGLEKVLINKFPNKLSDKTCSKDLDKADCLIEKTGKNKLKYTDREVGLKSLLIGNLGGNLGASLTDYTSAEMQSLLLKDIMRCNTLLGDKCDVRLTKNVINLTTEGYDVSAISEPLISIDNYLEKNL